MEQKEFTKPEKLKLYRRSLYNKLEKTKECQDINAEWKEIKNSMLNAATEAIQHENRKPRNEWWDDECKKQWKKKNSQNEVYK